MLLWLNLNRLSWINCAEIWEIIQGHTTKKWCKVERYICWFFSQFLSPLFPSSRVLQYDKRLKIRIIESLFSNFLKYLTQRKDNLSSFLQKTTLTVHRENTDNRYALLTAYVYNGSIFFTDMTYHIKLCPYYTKWCTLQNQFANITQL